MASFLGEPSTRSVRQLQPWDGPRAAGPVSAAGLPPDGSRVVSGRADGMVRLTWIGRTGKKLIEHARVRLPRELTPDERRRFYFGLE